MRMGNRKLDSWSESKKWKETTVPLPQGVIVIESDTGRGKMGNGENVYVDLPYIDDSIASCLITVEKIQNGSENRWKGIFTSVDSLPTDVDNYSLAIVKVDTGADVYVYIDSKWCIFGKQVNAVLTDEEKKLAEMSGGETLEYCGRDAYRWAESFVATLKVKQLDPTDVAWMTSWFAAAIERSGDEHLWSGTRFTQNGLLGAVHSFAEYIGNSGAVQPPQSLSPHMIVELLSQWTKRHGLVYHDYKDMDQSWDRNASVNEADVALIDKLMELKFFINKSGRTEQEFDAVVDALGLNDRIREKISDQRRKFEPFIDDQTPMVESEDEKFVLALQLTELICRTLTAMNESSENRKNQQSMVPDEIRSLLMNIHQQYKSMAEMPLDEYSRVADAIGAGGNRHLKFAIAGRLIRNIDIQALEAFLNIGDQWKKDDLLSRLRSFKFDPDEIAKSLAQRTLQLKVEGVDALDFLANLLSSRKGKPKKSPEKINMLKANDVTSSFLVRDNVVKTDVVANVFDLAAAANSAYFARFDFTDLVAEGGRVSTILVEFTYQYNDLVRKEVVEFPTEFLASAIYRPHDPETSTDRLALKYVGEYSFNPTSEIGPYVCANIPTIKVEIALESDLVRKSGDIIGKGFITLELPGDPNMIRQALYNNLTAKVIGFTPTLFLAQE